MKVSNAATSQAWKLLKLSISLFRRSFNASKCKTAAKMAVARIKLLRNKREVVVKQMRRDIALLLQSGQDATARIRVEHVIREQNVLAANELIELFCELVVARLSIIAKQRECPADLKEGIASVIFAAPRCSEIPELVALRDVFEKKYGKDFVSAATDLRPTCGVNRMLIDKLSVRTPTGEVKLKIMKEIAKEYEIQWDTTESENELLKPAEELIEGPKTFVSATSMPVKAAPIQSVEPNKPQTSRTNGRTNGSMQFEDTASAAEAAAKSAKEAIAAAQAAAYLAKKDLNRVSPNTPCFDDNTSYNMSITHETFNFQNMDQAPMRMYESRSFNRSHYPDVETDIGHLDNEKIYRRHSCNVPTTNSDLNFKQSYNESDIIKFDESDCDEEIEAEAPPGGFCLPPERPAPPPPSSQPGKVQGPVVHPKLPDYDTLAARFEALKHHKSQTQKKY